MKLDHIDNGSEFDFGKVSNDYALYRDIYPKSMYDKLVQFGIGKQSQRILDLGSGTAVLPVNMAHNGAVFTATDISENQIQFGRKTAAERGIDNIDFKVCSAEDTGFEDNTFDAVTAVQCFQYFDAEKAANEIFRILKPQGLFCKIFMDWLSYEDEIVSETERLVLKYNPDWSGSGFEKFRYSYPEWADRKFDIDTIHSYNATLEFSKDSWIGRIRSCRGVGASLPHDMVAKLEKELRGQLDKYSEPLHIMHQIHIEIYRSCKNILLS